MHTSRNSPVNLSREDFRKIGHTLVDELAEFFETIGDRPVTRGESPGQIRELLGNLPLPADGQTPGVLFERAAELLMNHSLFNGHPKFFGYITGSPSPAGALAELLAASMNPNMGANILSPMATAMETQTVQWLSEFIGLPASYGGILVSGGNMANFTAFLAARNTILNNTTRETGLRALDGEPVFYCSKATHTWIEKAAVLFGHGTSAIRWIPVDRKQQMDIGLLVKTISEDIANGKRPFLVIANAGDVSTGAIDNLSALAQVCKQYSLWLHVDGAYGIPAAVVPECSALFDGIAEADSVALDPHKWLYAPIEVGCTLVKNPQHLTNTFSSHPVYYNFDDPAEESLINYYEYGFQNSRGFRALKVWIMLQQAGKNGYINMIRDDMALSRLLFQLAQQHPELEAVTQNLSITTLRYVPEGMIATENHSYLNELNGNLLNRLQKNGEVFLSNALINDVYCLRACFVNFRATEKDVHEMVDIIVREGRALQ